AVLAWIKSGPSTLPTNLRAGRVVYYTSIPTTTTANGGDSTAVALDKVFWKNYIDYVFGAAFTGDSYLAGIENKGWPEGVTPAISANATSGYSPGTGTDPLPHLHYTEHPSRPRLHFWFGPITMMQFISEQGSSTSRDYWPGTVHEAQAWQLKAAINSVLDDIKNNHPNDYVGLA